MAQHKAATEVTIAPIGERTALASFFERYWKGLAIASALLAAAILFRTFRETESLRVEATSWNEFGSAVELTSSQFGLPQANFNATPDELLKLAAKHTGQPAAPWFIAMAATASANRDDFSGAATIAARLRSEYPGHPLANWTLFEDGGEAVAPATLLEQRARSMSEWRASRASLFQNPPPAEGSPRVRLDTSAGPIEVALYPEAAPKHVENFLKLVDEGFFNGVRFHRVVPDFMIQGGDPNTKGLDTATWGTGGPEYKIDLEPNDLVHFRGSLAAAKMGGDTQSSGSQFYITTGTPHHLDGQHTVFGTVVSGWPAIETIEQGEVVTGTDRPREPATITGASRL